MVDGATATLCGYSGRGGGLFWERKREGTHKILGTGQSLLLGHDAEHIIFAIGVCDNDAHLGERDAFVHGRALAHWGSAIAASTPTATTTAAAPAVLRHESLHAARDLSANMEA